MSGGKWWRGELGQEEVKESDSSTATTSRQATRCSSHEGRNPSVILELKRGPCWQRHRYRSFAAQPWNRLATSPVRLGSSNKVARIGSLRLSTYVQEDNHPVRRWWLRSRHRATHYRHRPSAHHLGEHSGTECHRFATRMKSRVHGEM